MPFREYCINLDKKQMSKPVQYHETMRGLEPIVGELHYVCQHPDNHGWISKCPDDCPFFENEG